MKHLILFLLFQGSLDCFAQSDSTKYQGFYRHDLGWECKCNECLMASKPDTIPEWMHVSTTRAKGFVMARKALSVQVNGICISHLDCERKPFPTHYKVGWCEGRERLLNRLIELLNYKK